MKELASAEQNQLAGKIRDFMATYDEAEDLINIGAYASGSNPNIDQSINFHEPIESFLKQQVGEMSTHEETIEAMAQIFGLDYSQYVTVSE